VSAAFGVVSQADQDAQARRVQESDTAQVDDDPLGARGFPLADLAFEDSAGGKVEISLRRDPQFARLIRAGGRGRFSEPLAGLRVGGHARFSAAT
jgi:hypothetical protein